MIYTRSLTDVQSGALFSPLGHSSPYPHPLEGKKILDFLLFFALIGCRFYMRIITSITSYCVKLSIYWIHMWIEKSSRGLPNCYNTFTLSFPIFVRRQIYELEYAPNPTPTICSWNSWRHNITQMGFVFVCFLFIIILNYTSPWTWPWHSVIG